MTRPTRSWPRLILHVDINAFFPSVEELDFPELREIPLAVTNGERGSAIISSSYPARKYGVKTGMPLSVARRLCPELVQRPSRPNRYIEMSMLIMDALRDRVSPTQECFGPDECWLDVTSCQDLLGSPAAIGALAKQVVLDASGGLLCSVGVAADKSTAKVASDYQKPDGLTIVPADEAAAWLAPQPCSVLCGVGAATAHFLAERGVHTCGDLARLPASVLGHRYGAIGLRLWMAAQGRDPNPVNTRDAAIKSMGHGKVLPPATRDRNLVTAYFDHMVEMLAARLRRHGLEAQHFVASLVLDNECLTRTLATPIPTSQAREIRVVCEMLLRAWSTTPAYQVHVQATDPMPAGLQPDLFNQVDKKEEKVEAVLDKINEKYGEGTLIRARLLDRSQQPQVISPAWKSRGPKQTIR